MKHKLLFNYLLLAIAVLIASCSKDDSSDNPLAFENCIFSEYDWAFGGNTGDMKFTYTNNQLTSVSSTFTRNGMTSSGTSEIEYDDQGRVIFLRTDDENYVDISYSEGFIDVRRVTTIPFFNSTLRYILNENGQIIELEGKERYEYNEEGQLVRIFNIKSLPEYLEEEHVYDNKKNPFEGIPITVIAYLNDQSILHDFHFEVAGPNNKIRTTNYDSEGEILSQFEVEFTYNPLDYPLTWTDESGNFSSFSYDCE